MTQKKKKNGSNR